MSRRALFERSELACLPCLAFISLNEAGRGVTGFGSFCRNKRPVLSQVEGASAAGTKSGNTEKHGDTQVREKEATHSPTNASQLEDLKIHFR